MNKLAKGLIKNLSLIAFTIGMIGAFVTYDALKEQRGANEDLIQIEIENAGSAELVGKYVDIYGGVPEVGQVYEYGIGDLGDGEGMVASFFYYPVVLTEGGVPQFIVVADTPPAIGADNSVSRVGLLKTYGDIPDKVANEFAVQYPDASFVLLDTQYEPAPIVEKYMNFAGFLLLIVASFLAFRYAVREAPKKEDTVT